MLDGMWLSVRRNTVEKEVVLFVLGIDEKGRREILDLRLIFQKELELEVGWRWYFRSKGRTLGDVPQEALLMAYTKLLTLSKEITA